MTAESSQAERPGYDRRMTREEINRLPIGRFKGPVKVIRTHEELARAVEHLGRETVIGFDTETRPTFAKGENHAVALLQLAGERMVYIFQLRCTGLPETLCRILSSRHIVKAGVAWDQDVAKLKELHDFTEAGFVDLGKVAHRAGMKNHGLRGLTAVILGFRITKQAQRSNWARRDLLPMQVRYAAMDAWVSREIYVRFKKRGMIKESA